MDKKPISKLFEHEGLIISKTSDEEIYDLNHQELVALFEQHGIIVFRGFVFIGILFAFASYSLTFKSGKYNLDESLSLSFCFWEIG